MMSIQIKTLIANVSDQFKKTIYNRKCFSYQFRDQL